MTTAGTLPTRRELLILGAISDHMDRYGYPPSVREIGAAAGMSSTSTVAHHLAVMQRKGFIRRDPGRARAISVVWPEEARS